MRTAMVDIETTHLKANFGVILCAGVKPLGGKPVMIVKKNKGSDDRDIVVRIAEELEKYDLIVTYFGKRFDIMFINTKLLKYGQPPLNPNMKHVDMYNASRKALLIHSRRLGSVTNYLGITGKDQVDPDLWLKAALDGDKKAMEYIVEHCRKDVEILEDLYNYPGMKQFITISKVTP